MTYRTVFEISWQTFPWPAAIVGVAGLAVGAIVLRSKRAERSGAWKLVGDLLLGFALLWIGWNVFDHYRMTQALAAHETQIAEGTIQDYEFRLHDGHGFESFTVNGVRFHYSDFIPTGGYNRPASNGGVIREGLQVRIHHVGNTILRLEVAP